MDRKEMVEMHHKINETKHLIAHIAQLFDKRKLVDYIKRNDGSMSKAYSNSLYLKHKSGGSAVADLMFNRCRELRDFRNDRARYTFANKLSGLVHKTDKMFRRVVDKVRPSASVVVEDATRDGVGVKPGWRGGSYNTLHVNLHKSYAAVVVGSGLEVLVGNRITLDLRFQCDTDEGVSVFWGKWLRFKDGTALVEDGYIARLGTIHVIDDSIADAVRRCRKAVGREAMANF